MIFSFDNQPPIDTADLTSEERHVIQKLMAWHSLADSMDFYTAKVQQALNTGWNHSGPVRPSPELKRIMRHLEETLALKLAPAE